MAVWNKSHTETKNYGFKTIPVISPMYRFITKDRFKYNKIMHYVVMFWVRYGYDCNLK